ncbi:hypothetical protein [Mycobacterium marseillense]|uniref:hypothetical protein n=1 Tax=Mycobacterium marseillense TaxID=701042 RepID=UPI001041E187|nr:hypothetical protein [Mycobacterium marseillense]MCA2266024.1 hypothetical protein [Mycobacterium marseillense]
MDFSAIHTLRLPEIKFADWLAILGIAFTIFQVMRVGRVVRQVRNGLRNASAQASVYNVLAVAPGLTGIEHQLELAARYNDVEEFSSFLRSYKYLAAELNGLLHQEAKHSDDARLKLQKSLAQVTAAKLPASDPQPDNLYEKTKQVRRSISEASVAIVDLTARLRSDLVPVEAQKRPGVVKRLSAALEGRRKSKDGK